MTQLKSNAREGDLEVTKETQLNSNASDTSVANLYWLGKIISDGSGDLNN